MGSREDDEYWTAKYDYCDCAECSGIEWCIYCGGELNEDSKCEECDED